MQHQHDGTQIPSAAKLGHKRKYPWDTATEPSELWTVEVGNSNFIILILMEQKEEKKGATEGEITMLSENHSFQNHTCQHQQTAGTIIRAQTLTQRGFPWMTNTGISFRAVGMPTRDVHKNTLSDQAQADWAVLQVLVTEMFFFIFHMASAQFFCSIIFTLSLLNSTWHTSALLNIFSSALFALFHSCSAGMCRHSSPKASQLPSATWQEKISCLSSHRRSWSF